MSAPKSRISSPLRRPARLLRRPARLPRRPGRSRDGGHSAVLSGPHAVELAGLLHELSARLLGAPSFDAAIERLVAFLAATVPGTVRCSVTLIGEGGPPTRTANGPRGESLDTIAYESSTGPGLDAARSHALTVADDLTADARWPHLAEPAATAGIAAVVAVPLDVPRAEVGAVSVYLDRPGTPGPDVLVTAMALVNQAEVLLGELRRRDETSTHATVDRAIGVIIAQRGCSVREAHDVLGETAQRLGLDRQAVADRLIAAAARKA
ncbi:GAF and ANTAR domain-containing protein [Paractinoplanes ferrugineus]|uniref:GAF and ANTAR domain-containing protein n=1 Tax=Paractinoplanes ferrugineus TaxID=113564 RepID=UPI001EF22905|nr:ANTAR domain-containing protein [Actinoplanes ferrugineus]